MRYNTFSKVNLIPDMYSIVVLIFLFIFRAFGADTSPADDEGVPVCIDDRRTVSNIVWSCLATIFASTWLAIHPNVPGRKITDKGAISRTLERAKIMGIAILAPEVIVAWAVEQFKVAWKVRYGGYFGSGEAIQLIMEINRKECFRGICHSCLEREEE